ncbi:N-acetyltransferase family protein [Naasia sp. SYSU D00057]|uniref:GNAT family N-acetyltransferase n=1 Tax=Naasia sp. SYSU D00057 TaxID=2817380 RepID=UPI0027DDB616|nr:N-acetyltransferase family protein [Naasia sp. SYSU D00057]
MGVGAGVVVAPLAREHWRAVERIYQEGIATGNATFESAPPTAEEFFATRLPAHRFVAVESAHVVGWIAAAPVSSRAVYSGVVEHAVYVGEQAQGRGIGRLLLTALIESTERAGIWTLQASIFPENGISLILHESVGFRRVGTREGIAKMTYGPMAGRWRDTVLLERRSSVAGLV